MKVNKSRRARPGCVRCGANMDGVWSRQRYCSKVCANRDKNDKRRKPRAVCKLCGKPAPNPKQQACSAKCAYTLRKLKTRKPRTCPVCQKVYFSKGAIRLKYCSLKCYRAVQAVTAWIDGTCDRCGKAFHRRKVRTRPTQYKFCSQACASGFFAGVKSAMWRGGGDPNRGAAWIKLAESVRVRDGHCCQRCGKTQTENGQKLSVDHIRPWRSFTSKTEANDPTNLTSLCRSCHTKKTVVAERAWLKGDVLAMKQYERSVKLPPLFARP